MCSTLNVQHKCICAGRRPSIALFSEWTITFLLILHLVKYLYDHMQDYLYYKVLIICLFVYLQFTLEQLK